MAAHSKLGASSAERWFSCPGSVRLAALAPKQESSPYAEEGTAAHELAELCLNSKKDATDFIGQTVYNHEVTVDMAEAVQVYLNAVRETHAAHPGSELMVEKRFHLDWIDDVLFGTNDASVLAHFDTLYVFDYKHGAGVAVEVERNKQMLYYASGAARGVDVEKIVLVVAQPRKDHKDGPVRKWELSYDELIEWQQTELAPAVETALRPDAPLHAGDHCKWCPAKGTCPALRDFALAEAKTVFGDIEDAATIELPNPDMLSAEETAKILDSTPILDDWLKAVQKAAENRMIGGEDIPGYKLVRGKANRRYKNEEKAAKAAATLFGDKAFAEPKLRSIAQIEKAVGKKATKEFETEHVEVPEGKITVAPVSDKREALTISALAGKSFTALD